jgi:dTDP-4-dehydrorhamnose reductase
MSLSHTLTSSCPLPSKRRRVLVTGAAGRIGSYFARHAHDKHDLRLMVHQSNPREAVDAIAGFGEVVQGDIGDLAGMKELCRDIDTVLHLAANPSGSATWASLLPLNIAGTYHTFVAARAAGCRRVIFASSIHAVSGYPADVQVKTGDPPNPGDLYGVTKCFGEVLGRYMAEQEGLSTICLRIGGVQSLEDGRQEASLRLFDGFVSYRDLYQLIEKSIAAEHIQFAIFHALSDNHVKRLDISDARELLGYQPQDDVSKLNPLLAALNLRDRVMAHNVRSGGQRSGLRDDL